MAIPAGEQREGGEGFDRKMKQLQGQLVAVMGCGKSGVAAARLLHAVGARVVLVDEKPESGVSEEVLCLREQGVSLSCGKDFAKGFEGAELIVISPGVPTSLPAVERMRIRGVPVVGEIELASWFLNMPLIAVTGTNGKSTTVSLIGRILEESGQQPFVGGNLGTPLAEAALSIYECGLVTKGQPPSFSIAVVEVSSFQLETIDQFHPHIAVVLNVTPDHLDRYRSVADYLAAKARIFERQSSQDFAVVNADDPQLTEFPQKTRAELYGFSTKTKVQRGLYLERETLMTTVAGSPEVVMGRQDILLPGSHNVANVLAAVTVGLLCACPVESIRQAVSSFRGVGHALEIVRQRRGVLYVDDSKGTNPDATVKALESFDRPLVVILGGKNKGNDFSKLYEPLQRHAKHIILIGQATTELQHVLAGLDPMTPVSSMKAAVELASKVSQAGEVVLLSPACASFDMFRDYRDRGEQFQDCVNALTE